jgi:hypothetical protein
MAGQLGNQGMDFGKGMGELAFGRQNAPGNLLEQLIRLGTNIYGAGAGGAAGQGASSIGGQAALSAAA